MTPLEVDDVIRQSESNEVPSIIDDVIRQSDSNEVPCSSLCSTVTSESSTKVSRSEVIGSVRHSSDINIESIGSIQQR